MGAMTISRDEFLTAADAALGDLLPDAARIASPDGFAVKWAGAAVELATEYDATRSHELLVALRRPRSHDHPFEVADVLRATPCPAEHVARVQMIKRVTQRY